MGLKSNCSFMIERVLRRVLRRPRPINSFRGVFRNFEEAAIHIPRSKRVGYDIPETADWYRDRLNEVQHDDYPALFWLEQAFEGGQTLVEIGGHVGVAYYSFSKVLEGSESLRWTIVDVPSVTRAGEQLARERNRTNLHFANDLSQASAGCDILLASGSLQYLDGPLLPERISKMSPLPTHIIINKTPIRQIGEGYVTLQDIGVSVAPYRIHSRQELIGALEKLGYEVVATWHKDRRVVIPTRPDLTVKSYSGYYLRRASA